MTKKEQKELMDALAKFARLWRIAHPDTKALAGHGVGIRAHMPGAWPTWDDCKAASDLLDRLGYDFYANRR